MLTFSMLILGRCTGANEYFIATIVNVDLWPCDFLPVDVLPDRGVSIGIILQVLISELWLLKTSVSSVSTQLWLRGTEEKMNVKNNILSQQLASNKAHIWPHYGSDMRRMRSLLAFFGGKSWDMLWLWAAKCFKESTQRAFEEIYFSFKGQGLKRSTNLAGYAYNSVLHKVMTWVGVSFKLVKCIQNIQEGTSRLIENWSQPTKSMNGSPAEVCRAADVTTVSDLRLQQKVQASTGVTGTWSGGFARCWLPRCSCCICSNVREVPHMRP